MVVSLSDLDERLRKIDPLQVLGALVFVGVIGYGIYGCIPRSQERQAQAQESNDSRPLTTPQFYLRELRRLRGDNKYEIIVSEPRGYNGFLHYFSNNVPREEENNIVANAFCPTDLNFPDPNRNDADYRLSVMESAGCSPETREIKLPVERVLLTLHIEGAEKRIP